ncbi:hypothetical protein [Williamsia sp. Leaf354]|uniref:hypothetical protein n=1 Tax=Williamsia sp. Leaf354 TaxID=1736349 RepID=UPI000AC2B146|nr:hypothetical protein [Williamsia sp. Leaf354]
MTASTRVGEDSRMVRELWSRGGHLTTMTTTKAPTSMDKPSTSDPTSAFSRLMDFAPFARHRWPSRIRVTAGGGEHGKVYPIRSVAADGSETDTIWVRTPEAGRGSPVEFYSDPQLSRLVSTLRPARRGSRVVDSFDRDMFTFRLNFWVGLFVTSWHFRDAQGQHIFTIRERVRDAIWRRLVFGPVKGCLGGSDIAGLLFAPLFAPFFLIKGHPRVSIVMPGHGRIGYIGHRKWASVRDGFDVRLDPRKPSPPWRDLAIAAVGAGERFAWGPSI